MDNSAQRLQAILYAHGGEMKRKEVASLMQLSLDDVEATAQQLQATLSGQGLELITTPDTLSLRSGSVFAEDIAALQKKDSEKDIGTAGLEVLAIVLYKGEVSRATIDYIRGVNSSGTLRQLVLRGLLERARHTDDARAWVYTATPELLAHLGISNVTELPDYGAMTHALQEPSQTQHHE